MDDFRESRISTSKGGTVEPGNRAAVAKATFQTPDPANSTEGPRFELRDAMSDLLYHAKDFDDMSVKADRIGALRFTAIDAQGQRSFVHKADGAWQRPPWMDRLETTQAASERATRSSTQGSAKLVPLTPALTTLPTASTEAVVARIDAEAEHAALVAKLEAALNERYVIKRALVTIGDRPVGQTEYRFRGDTTRVAFIESTFRLATDTNSPSVARSMVELAEARNWKTLRVTGHEEFRRMVWMEASLRGVKAIGYEPLPSDMAALRSALDARQVNRIEPERFTTSAVAPSTSGKASARGSGSRKTVLAAIEAVLVAQRVPQKRREAIMKAAADKLAQRLAAGEVHKVKVYDKAAPQQQPTVRPVPEQQRGRERTAHVR